MIVLRTQDSESLALTVTPEQAATVALLAVGGGVQSPLRTCCLFGEVQREAEGGYR